MDWIKLQKQKPKSGTILEVKVAKSGCAACSGYQTVECYFEDGIFNGIKNQNRVDFWRISPANDLIKEIDLRREIIAKGCVSCFI